MKLQDLNGAAYRLTKTKLITTSGDVLFWVKLSDVKKSLTMNTASVQLYLGQHGVGMYIKVPAVSYKGGGGQIGCRVFAKKEFALIEKAAKAVNKVAKPKK